MSGFSAASTAFLQALAQNNDRDWFAQNKAAYEESLKFPSQSFSQSMTQALEALTGLPHSAKVFRIYRDVRFSKAKTPYNTHQRISFIPDTPHPAPPAWMLSLEKDHLILGLGVLGYEKAALDTWRERCASREGEVLVTLLADMETAGYRMSGPDLKRVPGQYGADHPRADLLKRKGLTIWKDLPTADLIFGDKAVQNCLDEYDKMRPVFDWLIKA